MFITCLAQFWLFQYWCDAYMLYVIVDCDVRARAARYENAIGYNMDRPLLCKNNNVRMCAHVQLFHN